MCQSVRAALTKLSQTRRLDSKLFFTILEAGKPKTKALADWVSGEGPVPGSQVAVWSSHGRRELSGVSSCEDTDPICEGPTLMTYSPPKGAPLNVTLAGRFQHRNFWGHSHSAMTIVPFHNQDMDTTSFDLVQILPVLQMDFVS